MRFKDLQILKNRKKLITLTQIKTINSKTSLVNGINPLTI
jgi:hypothetical protein